MLRPGTDIRASESMPPSAQKRAVLWRRRRVDFETTIAWLYQQAACLLRAGWLAGWLVDHHKDFDERMQNDIKTGRSIAQIICRLDIRCLVALQSYSVQTHHKRDETTRGDYIIRKD